MSQLNETHDPNLKSWVGKANAPSTDFPIQNLPFAIFRKKGSSESFRGGVAIGDQVLDLERAHASRLFAGDALTAVAQAARPELNGLMALGPKYWSALRLSLSRLLREGASQADRLRPMLIAQADIEFSVPARVGDYTDFYASVYHASNIGKLFRPDSPLTPNFKWMPIAYHGRASSIAVSGQSFPRPRGQILPPGASSPVFSECKRLDFELELGVWMGPGNQPGHPIALADADQHLFGMCLLNDWSARDIQSWEYVPLGPFLAKNFATTISPWIITLEALAPFQWPGCGRKMIRNPCLISKIRTTANKAQSISRSNPGWRVKACARPLSRPAECHIRASGILTGTSGRCWSTIRSVDAT